MDVSAPALRSSVVSADFNANNDVSGTFDGPDLAVRSDPTGHGKGRRVVYTGSEPLAAFSPLAVYRCLLMRDDEGQGSFDGQFKRYGSWAFWRRYSVGTRVDDHEWHCLPVGDTIDATGEDAAGDADHHTWWQEGELSPLALAAAWKALNASLLVDMRRHAVWQTSAGPALRLPTSAHLFKCVVTLQGLKPSPCARALRKATVRPRRSRPVLRQRTIRRRAAQRRPPLRRAPVWQLEALVRHALPRPFDAAAVTGRGADLVLRQGLYARLRRECRVHRPRHALDRAAHAAPALGGVPHAGPADRVCPAARVPVQREAAGLRGARRRDARRPLWRVGCRCERHARVGRAAARPRAAGGAPCG